jgi:hypothetical protein
VNAKQLGRAAAAAFGVLLVLNALVFPFVFPEGTPVEYQNARAEPLFLMHALALLATAVLMTLIYAIVYRGAGSWFEGLKMGALLGLMVAFPWSLHRYALVETTYADQIAPIIWTVVTWAVAGAVIGGICRRAETAAPT